MDNHNEGFSLVEVLIVVAILAIMSAGVTAGLGYLNMANASKCVTKIDSGISLLKTKNMAEAVPTYMHLYKYNGNFYIEYSSDPSYTPANADNGERIGGKQLSISYKDGDDAVTNLDGGNSCKTFGIRKKDGAFTGATEPTCEISVTNVSSQSTHKVTLVTNTGKHFRD